MPEVDYKKSVGKWAERRNFSVSFVTTHDNFPGKEGHKTTCVRCNKFNLCLFVDADESENVDQCEQRAARQFLQTYGRSMVGLRN